MSKEDDDWEEILTVTKKKVVERYLNWVEIENPRIAKDFRSRLLVQREPIAAEAVVWESLTRQFNANPKIADEHGGPDFLCNIGGFEFFVEVASLDAESVADRTNLPNEIDSGARMFGFDHKKVRDVITKKQKQLEDRLHPVVLAICSEHIKASMLFGDLGARNMMFGTLGFQVPLGQARPKVTDTANFEDSIWLNLETSGAVVISRDYPSALLLVSVGERASLFTGLLHPQPAREFPYQLLGGVPFRRFVVWPPKDGKLSLEWVVHEPPARHVGYLITEKD